MLNGATIWELTEKTRRNKKTNEIKKLIQVPELYFCFLLKVFNELFVNFMLIFDTQLLSISCLIYKLRVLITI